MPVYQTRSADPLGKRLTRTIAAESRTAAAALATEDGSMLISLKEIVSARGKKPSAAFVLELTQTLALLSQSGLDIRESLEIAGTLFPEGRSGGKRKREGKKRNGRTVAALASALDRGDSFSTAAEAENFPPIYSGLIKIGERTGSMSVILPAMASYLKSRKEMKDKLLNAMLYPSLVLSAVLIGILVLMIVVVPKMGEILSGFGSSPEMTGAMELRMHASMLIGGIAAGGLILSMILFILLRRTSRQFRLKSDGILVTLPLLGPLITLQETVNIVFALEVLTGAGISLEDALEQASPVTRNLSLSNGLLEAREKIIQGHRPSEAFRAAGVFPLRLVRWLALGERTGRVEEVFSGLKTWYQGEFETLLVRITGLAEPAMIIITGLLLLAGIIIFVLPLLSGFGNLF